MVRQEARHSLHVQGCTVLKPHVVQSCSAVKPGRDGQCTDRNCLGAVHSTSSPNAHRAAIVLLPFVQVFIPLGILMGVPGVTWEAFLFKNLIPGAPPACPTWHVCSQLL